MGVEKNTSYNLTASCTVSRPRLCQLLFLNLKSAFELIFDVIMENAGKMLLQYVVLLQKLAGTEIFV